MSRPIDKVVATGGIGTGMLFLSRVDETLGRNESRMVELSPARDYCKQQIVLSTTTELLRETIPVHPVGLVGRDAYGEQLRAEMEAHGMDCAWVRATDAPTMISICLQYPDRQGCNFTAENSASGRLTPQAVLEAMDGIGVDEHTMVAVIPEVPVEARMAMLREGRRRGALTVLSVPSAEAGVFKEAGALACCDLLAVNEEEAAALCGETGGYREVAQALGRLMEEQSPGAMVMMTCGKNGLFTVQGGRVEFVPPLPAEEKNTTGAGDACLGGTMAGLALGLPLQKGHDDAAFGQTPLASAAELGTLCAGMATECEDSIAYNVTWQSIGERIKRRGWARQWPLK